MLEGHDHKVNAQGRHFAGQPVGDKVVGNRRGRVNAHGDQRCDEQSPQAAAVKPQIFEQVGNCRADARDAAKNADPVPRGRIQGHHGDDPHGAQSGHQEDPVAYPANIVDLVFPETGREDCDRSHDEEDVEADQAVDDDGSDDARLLVAMFAAEHHRLDQVPADDSQRHRSNKKSPEANANRIVEPRRHTQGPNQTPTNERRSERDWWRRPPEPQPERPNASAAGRGSQRHYLQRRSWSWKRPNEIGDNSQRDADFENRSQCFPAHKVLNSHGTWTIAVYLACLVTARASVRLAAARARQEP